MPGPGIEPMPHWWKGSALITAPSLLSIQKVILNVYTETKRYPLSACTHASVINLALYWFTNKLYMDKIGLQQVQYVSHSEVAYHLP